MRKFGRICGAATLALSGCAGGASEAIAPPPTREMIASTDFGNPPIQTAEEIARRVLEPGLFDPFSAVYRVDGPPARMWVRRPGAVLFGYGLCVSVNAKNRMGGYTGFKPYFFLVRGDQIILDSATDLRLFAFELCPGQYLERSTQVAHVLGQAGEAVVGAGQQVPAKQSSASVASQSLTQFRVPMSGAQEVPVSTTGASGVAELTLDRGAKKLMWNIRLEGLTGTPTAAFIQGPAAIGKNGGVVVNLARPGNIGSSIIGGTDLTDAQISQLLAGQYYINIHTTSVKAGEVRGQIIP